MAKRSWIAALAAPLVLIQLGASHAEEAKSDPTGSGALGGDVPRIIGVDARPESGRTLVRIETTSSSVNFISYTKNPTTFIVDVYGTELSGVPSEIPVNSPEVRAVHLDYTPSGPGLTSVARFVVERAAPGGNSIRMEGNFLVVEARTGGGTPQRTASRPARAPAVPADPGTPAAPATIPGAVVTSPEPLGPAHRLDEISTESKTDQDLSVLLRGDGKLEYESFTLDNPPRLVIDVRGVDNQVARGQVAVHHPAVNRIRVSQFKGEPDKVTRVVLDLGSPLDYRVVPTGAGLQIAFGDATAIESPVTPIDMGSAIESAQGTPAGSASVSSGNAGTSTEATLQGEAAEEEGTLISLDLKDADIKDVLRYFSEISGLNIILDQAVQGDVTVRLIDVPWNKALDIILRSHGYGKTLEGNVLRIAPVLKLQEEEKQAGELQKQQIENKPLITITRPVSYADSKDIALVISQTALSKKGSIIIDARTNTLVITEVDIPEYRQRILDLIRTLDTPTPQVEIEARIVTTISSVARSFGIQYGFNNRFDTTTGNTTDFTFPNSGVIRGDILRTDSGVNSLLPGGGYAVNLPSLAANGAIGFHLADITNTFQLDLALTALESDAKGRVLAAPKITTQSNVAASIQSGRSIPVQTIANNTITTEYIAANLQLQVLPQVTAENTVILKILVESSSPDGTGTPTAPPPINVRRAQTTVTVPDGGTAVIGGVFGVDEASSQDRIPYLSKLPIIGLLFRNKNEVRINNELLIFITPKIRKITVPGAVIDTPTLVGNAAR